MGIRLADDPWQLLGKVGAVGMLLAYVLPGLLELVGILEIAAVPTVAVGSVSHSALLGAVILLFGVGYLRSGSLDEERPVYLGSPPPAERRSSAERDAFLEPGPTEPAEDDRAPDGFGERDRPGGVDRSESTGGPERAGGGSRDPAVERN